MKAIITKTLGGFFFVADKKQKIYKTHIRGRIQKTVYPGDRVEFSPEKMLIEKVLPRKKLLKRPKVANVNQILIVQAYKEPEFDIRLLDRFLILAEAANLKPVIIINKIDLAGQENLEKDFSYYNNIGYDLCFVSVEDNWGIKDLENCLHNKINVMAGPSGTGKSSIINKLIPDVNLPTGKLSKKLKRGVHTTRHVELLSLPTGGWIADTPGFTSLNIDHIDPRNLRCYFPEFIKYTPKCKFNTCSHIHEPQCAVKEAVNNGEISSRRYRSYKLFYEELNK